MSKCEGAHTESCACYLSMQSYASVELSSVQIIRGNDKEHVNVTLESSDSLTILPPKPRKARPKRSLPPQEPQPVQSQNFDLGCTLLDEDSDDPEVLPAQVKCI